MLILAGHGCRLKRLHGEPYLVKSSANTFSVLIQYLRLP